MRYFLFLDESGDASLVNLDKRFDIFVLCGILFREDHYAKFNLAMNQIKTEIFGTEDITFHSYEMRWKTGIFELFQDKRIQQRFYELIGKLFSSHDYRIIASVIDKSKYKDTYPQLDEAYEDSLKFICERAITSIRRSRTDDNLIVCIEKRGKGKDGYIKKHYGNMINYGTDYISTYEFQICSPTLQFRGKNDKVNGIEFADLCAYPIASKSLHPERNQPTFELMRPKFNASKMGEITGIGIKYFP